MLEDSIEVPFRHNHDLPRPFDFAVLHEVNLIELF